MTELTRREAVLGGVASIAALAGCSTGSGSSSSNEDPRLDRLRVGNRLPRDVELDLQLELDGEVVFWRDVPLSASNEGQTDESATFEPPAFPRDRGEWLLRARIRGEDETYTTEFTSETTAESCLDLGVNIQEDGIEITYVATHSCDDVTTTSES
jgi:hypothetical protein